MKHLDNQRGLLPIAVEVILLVAAFTLLAHTGTVRKPAKVRVSPPVAAMAIDSNQPDTTTENTTSERGGKPILPQSYD